MDDFFGMHFMKKNILYACNPEMCHFKLFLMEIFFSKLSIGLDVIVAPEKDLE